LGCRPFSSVKTLREEKSKIQGTRYKGKNPRYKAQGRQNPKPKIQGTGNTKDKKKSNYFF
jgi:hypothetical protein